MANYCKEIKYETKYRKSTKIFDIVKRNERKKSKDSMANSSPWKLNTLTCLNKEIIFNQQLGSYKSHGRLSVKLQKLCEKVI